MPSRTRRASWRSLVRKGGGGGGGSAPPIVIVQSTFVQAGLDTGIFSLPANPTAGNLIVAATCSRGSPTACTFGGLVAVAQPIIDAGSIGNSSIGLWSRISAGGNQFDFANGTSNSQFVWLAEVSGADTLDTFSGAPPTLSGQAATTDMALPGYTPNPAKSKALLVNIWGQAIDDGTGGVVYTLPASPGWNIVAQGATQGTGRPWGVVATQIIQPPAQKAATAHNNVGQARAWGAIQAAFVRAAG